jgi:glycosyltransferase involved in cell wall biosynthesis
LGRSSPVEDVRVSVVMPCFNEAENVTECVRSARNVLDQHGIDGEVIVVDNASTDGSGDLARSAGAIVVLEPRRGYGNAYLAGFQAARGRHIVMADADLTYDFGDIPRFLSELDAGADLVMGKRRDNIDPGAMPWLNQRIGNPLMTSLLNMIYRTGVKDVWCGMRGLRRDALPALDLQADGMEFALEMLIRASEQRLVIREIPIALHARGGTSKLSPFRDGARALRLMLTLSPTYLFMMPGVLMALIGASMATIVLANADVLGRHWLLHTLIAGSLLTVVGVQVFALGLCGQAYQTLFMNKTGNLFDRFRDRVRLSHGLLAGSALLIAGVTLEVVVLIRWAERSFGPLYEERAAVLASTLAILGVETIFVALFLSLLGLRAPSSRRADNGRAVSHIGRLPPDRDS